MEVVYRCCCGIDVHKNLIVACLREGDRQELREFGTMTGEIKAFVDALGWLWWNGKRWERDDHKATAWAMELSEKMLLDAKEENRAALYQFAEATVKYSETGAAEDAEALLPALRQEVFPCFAGCCLSWHFCHLQTMQKGF